MINVAPQHHTREIFIAHVNYLESTQIQVQQQYLLTKNFLTLLFLKQENQRIYYIYRAYKLSLLNFKKKKWLLI